MNVCFTLYIDIRIHIFVQSNISCFSSQILMCVLHFNIDIRIHRKTLKMYVLHQMNLETQFANRNIPLAVRVFTFYLLGFYCSSFYVCFPPYYVFFCYSFILPSFLPFFFLCIIFFLFFFLFLCLFTLYVVSIFLPFVVPVSDFNLLQYVSCCLFFLSLALSLFVCICFSTFYCLFSLYLFLYV